MSIKHFKEPFQYKKIPLKNFTKEKNKKQKKARNTAGTVRRIWSYLAKEKGKLTLVILMVLISSGLSLLGPFMVGTAVDKYIEKEQSAGLGILLMWLVFIYLFHSLSIFLQNFWMVGIAQNTVFALRDNLFRQFHRLPISFFDKN